jgi:hypothetical protein
MNSLRLIAVAAATALPLVFGSVGASAQMAEAPAATPGGGACSFTQKNMFAGPFSVCQEEVAAADCDTIGTSDENSGQTHAAGMCTRDASVGECDTDGIDTVYYEGDAFGLEIGCGFQSGTWIPAE